MYRIKKRPAPSSSVSKLSTNEFYVGTKRWQLKMNTSVTDDLLKYTNYCFSSIYGLLEKRTRILVDESPYEIILQFMCVILKYNNLYYSLVQMKRRRADLLDLNTIKYKVIEDADITMAECVFYGETEDLLYFNARLIKLCLSYANQNVCINFPLELLEHHVKFEYYSTQRDILPINETLLPKLCILFMIAEHAVLHLPEKKPDYISHKSTQKSNLFTFHTYIKFNMTGDIVSILKQKMDESEQFFSI